MSDEAARIARLERRIADLEHQLGRRRPGTYEREEFLVRAFEDAPIGMALVGTDERILEANAALCDMLGYTHDELLRKSVPDITHPDDRLVEAQPKGAMKAGAALAFVVEKRYVRADGSTLEGRLSVTALYDEQAKPAYFLGQLEDVTRERVAERARRTHEARFRSIFEHTTDALILLRSDGQVQSINARAVGIFPDIVLGQPAPPLLLAPATELLATGAAGVTLDLHVGTVAGELDLEAIFAAIPLPADPLPPGRSVLVALRDVSERRRAERALGLALDRVSRTLVEREVLLKEVHHRVKNNLQIVSSLLQLQADEADPAARSSLTESVLRVRSMSLVHQMLYDGADLSTIDLGTYARTLITHLQSSLGEAVDVTLQVDREVSVAVDRAIPVGLILNELLTNALKYGRSPDGRCRLTVNVQYGVGAVTVEVADEGPGLPRDFLTTSGRSLGRQIMRALVRQLGASIELGSGRGATIRLQVPLPTSGAEGRESPAPA